MSHDRPLTLAGERGNLLPVLPRSLARNLVEGVPEAHAGPSRGEHVGEVAARPETVLRAADSVGGLTHAGHGVLVEQVLGIERQCPVVLRERS